MLQVNTGKEAWFQMEMRELSTLEARIKENLVKELKSLMASDKITGFSRCLVDYGRKYEFDFRIRTSPSSAWDVSGNILFEEGIILASLDNNSHMRFSMDMHTENPAIKLYDVFNALIQNIVKDLENVG